QCVAREKEYRAGERDLEGRGVVAVAHERVRDPVGHRVDRAAWTDPEMLPARATQVLHRRKRGRPQDTQAHPETGWAARSSKAARGMGTNATVSPGARRLARSRVGSNSASGVRPIRFQPPGVANE